MDAFLDPARWKNMSIPGWRCKHICGLFVNHAKQSEFFREASIWSKPLILHLAHYFLEQLRTHVNWLCTRWWFQISFIFTPKIGEDEPFWLVIFQMGWFNHQLSYASYIDMYHPPLYHGNLRSVASGEEEHGHQRGWWLARERNLWTMQALSNYTVVQVDGTTPNRWGLVRDHDKPSQWSCAIDPFRVGILVSTTIITKSSRKVGTEISEIM